MESGKSPNDGRIEDRQIDSRTLDTGYGDATRPTLIERRRTPSCSCAASIRAGRWPPPSHGLEGETAKDDVLFCTNHGVFCQPNAVPWPEDCPERRLHTRRCDPYQAVVSLRLSEDEIAPGSRRAPLTRRTVYQCMTILPDGTLFCGSARCRACFTRIRWVDRGPLRSDTAVRRPPAVGSFPTAGENTCPQRPPYVRTEKKEGAGQPVPPHTSLRLFTAPGVPSRRPPEATECTPPGCQQPRP